ncbi:MAG: hypothetical protein WBJ29_05765 [Fervidobacterium sp.]|nr:hypothetical protein [Fervidobacterium sp.]HOM74130.1 hypothetical protein [Fervidobacterium sp.]HPP17781.1 hypothetical protein [Fervidobacterium sp.]HRD20041.1 hypothetical protein [Fervidobacterium sp.]
MLRSKNITLITLTILLIPIYIFPYFNVGAGYNYGDVNNWLLRIGYEEDTFSFSSDYLLNKGWYFTGDITFDTQFGFEVGPMLYANYDLSSQGFDAKFGGVIKFAYRNFDIRMGVVTSLRSSFNLSESICAKIRLYVPDPQGMKMRDKLYIELGYHNPNFSISVGLLEPF